MSPLLIELCVILVLIVANGFFAAAEIAIVAAGKGRLEQQASEGSSAARTALKLSEDPRKFLATVQVGITLVGTFAAAFGGARLGNYLAEEFRASQFTWLSRNAEKAALTIVVLGIAYLSIVLGELVPKRIALQNANSLALFAARPMQALALLARPAVALMARSTDLVLALFRVKPARQPSVSLEDIQHLIETGTAEGILAPVEQRLAVEALRLGERTVKEIMRPRLDIDALDVNTPPSEVLGALAMAGFSRVPVYEGNLDHILGYVHLKDVVRQQYLGWPIDLRKLLHPPLFVPETLPVDKLLVRFQEQRNQMAIVLDEFGGTDGIVTLEDVLEELVGEMRHGESADAQQRIVARGEGSWLIDGLVSVADLVEALRLKEPKERRNYSTVSGIVRSELDRMPKIGDVVSWHGLRIEVVDMDGRRIDRVLVSTQPST